MTRATVCLINVVWIRPLLRAAPRIRRRRVWNNDRLIASVAIGTHARAGRGNTTTHACFTIAACILHGRNYLLLCSRRRWVATPDDPGQQVGEKTENDD